MKKKKTKQTGKNKCKLKKRERQEKNAIDPEIWEGRECGGKKFETRPTDSQRETSLDTPKARTKIDGNTSRETLSLFAVACFLEFSPSTLSLTRRHRPPRRRGRARQTDSPSTPRGVRVDRQQRRRRQTREELNRVPLRWNRNRSCGRASATAAHMSAPP
jgi:hypothetical protein